MILADFHIHPLSHKYYRTGQDMAAIHLDHEDKQAICDVVDWCADVRKLDAIALTDHDMLQSGLFAQEYARRKNMAMKIILGAECEVAMTLGGKSVHLLCLGVPVLPSYTQKTTVEAMVQKIHAQGGKCILAHPGQYPEIFYQFIDILDGYEYYNGGNGSFAQGKLFLEKRMKRLQPFFGSDFHYRGTLPPPLHPTFQPTPLPENWLKRSKWLIN